MKKSKEHYRMLRARTLKQGDVIYIPEQKLGKCVVDTVMFEEPPFIRVHLLTRKGPIYATLNTDALLIVRVSK